MREGLSFKKRRCIASERERPDVAAAAPAWKKYQGRLDPRRLVFIDETWTKTNMAPHACGPWGQRAKGAVPHGHWQTMTFLAALRYDRSTAPCVFDGPINGESFQLYVEQFLVPTLKPGDIVIMDNLGSHKGNAIRSAIRPSGANPALPAALQPRPQPHRAGLRQAQTPDAESRRTNHRSHLDDDRRISSTASRLESAHATSQTQDTIT